jgi:hypothetical protein
MVISLVNTQKSLFTPCRLWSPRNRLTVRPEENGEGEKMILYKRRKNIHVNVWQNSLIT